MTQFVFFSGKGGVGETSLACTQVWLHATEGQRTFDRHDRPRLESGRCV